MDYQEFLATKKIVFNPVGKRIDRDTVHPKLFEFQRDLVTWAVRKGRCAIFADTGLGKTFMLLEWARLIDERVLIVAPLSVALQTVREAAKLDIELTYVRNQQEAEGLQIAITNYDRIDDFNPELWGGVVLDESSILKSLRGSTKLKLVESFAAVPYRLCTSATPAPNDISEIANHAEFLGIMTRQEMLSCFFTYDAYGTSKSNSWRLKNHAIDNFYEWLASWGMAVKKPSDIGYKDDGYILPPLNVQTVPVAVDYTPEGMLPGFYMEGISAVDAKRIRRETITERTQIAAQMVNNSNEQWLIWAGLNDECDALLDAIPDAVNVEGKMSAEEKAQLLLDFQDEKVRVLITKISIAGMGMNWQQCHNMIFFGIDYSWEGYYQGVRRLYRFGQQHPVNVYIVTSEQELSIVDTVMQKEQSAVAMVEELVSKSANYARQQIHNVETEEFTYMTDEYNGRNWKMMLGDSVERITEIPDNSIDLSVYSPPFSDLFVYSATPRDLGNSKSLDEFFKHYSFIIRENLRITKPGNMACVHVMDTRALKSHDGFIGRKDFSGYVIEAYQDAGWTFWQRITVDKNPQVQAIRLRDHGLAFKTLRKDARRLSGGHADYLLVFKKPGDNPVPVDSYERGEITEDDWITWAHPVWYGIRETNTLNVAIARSDADEKHMAPLQLDLIERCVKLWSNPGETVFSPFAGVGSEGFEAIKHNRKFIGIELKPEYYEVAKSNLKNAEKLRGQTLFEWAADNTESE